MKSMKKWIAALVILSLALTLTACGPKGNGSGAEGDADGAFFGAEEGSYGKITSITGNEIEVALAKRPENISDDTVDWSEGNIQIPMGDNDMPVVGATIDSDIAEIELTGETMKLTVPAGVKIYSAGQETNLSGLKKGDMISIVFDSETPDAIRSIEKVG